MNVLKYFLPTLMAVSMCCSSTKNANNAFQFGDKKVYYSSTVLNHLSYVYDDMPRELAYCLMGAEIGENDFAVQDVVYPFHQESTNVNAKFDHGSCYNREGYLGLVHNHPNGNCTPSTIDLIRFQNDKNAKLEMIVCGAVRENQTLKTLVLFK